MLSRFFDHSGFSSFEAVMRNRGLKTACLVALFCAGGVNACRSAKNDLYNDLTHSGTGTSTGSGNLPPGCEGDPAKDPALVRDECGVFVDATAPTSGMGTKASPFKSVLEAAKKDEARIFICAGDYEEAATVELFHGVSMYGGFSACPRSGDWVWDDGKRATIHGPANVPAVRVTQGSNLIHSINVEAPDATKDGASSIAIVANETDLVIINADITAGHGKSGASGALPSGEPQKGTDASTSENTGTPACNGSQVPGKGAVTSCSDGMSRGGDGGKGGDVPNKDGAPGTDGDPLPVTNPDMLGLGGKPSSNPLVCNGAPGQDGEPGASGLGGSTIGTLTVDGIAGGDGEDGKVGARGYGGGGGAGAKAGTFCAPIASPTTGPGASGGGGGGGGCGGNPGGGGKAGGSSIGIVSLKSTFMFSGVAITSGNGASGGKGATNKGGAPGGFGASGGLASGISPSMAGCDGGKGGAGGPGGTGGGGRGGHSLGIAYKGTAPVLDGVKFTVGMPGTGGSGDPMAMGANDGAKGTAGNTLNFTN